MCMFSVVFPLLTRAGEQSAIWPSTIFSTFWTSYFSYKPSINFHETWGISRSGYDLEVSRKKKGKIIIQSWEKCCPKWLFFLGHVFPPHGLKKRKTLYKNFRRRIWPKSKNFLQTLRQEWKLSQKSEAYWILSKKAMSILQEFKIIEKIKSFIILWGPLAIFIQLFVSFFQYLTAKDTSWAKNFRQ